MLSVVLKQLDKLKLTAQGMQEAIGNQGKLIKKLNQRVEVSWRRLEKQDSAMQKVLIEYRSQNRLCRDFCMIVCITVLLTAVYWVYHKKGYV